MSADLLRIDRSRRRLGAGALGFAAISLAACGTTMEERAATGALGGAVVGGPVGAAIGAAVGAGVDVVADELDENDQAPRQREPELLGGPG